ncbi:MAG: ferredoxin [Chloroflexota bacterium]
MRVRIDRDKCTGVANCVAVAPTVFELDDEDKAVVADPYGAAEEVLWKAARSCPQGAVILEDDSGRPLYP